jgi:hypothetical protein
MQCNTAQHDVVGQILGIFLCRKEKEKKLPPEMRMQRSSQQAAAMRGCRNATPVNWGRFSWQKVQKKKKSLHSTRHIESDACEH